MAPKGKTAPDARSFADPIVYMSKDRTKGFHSFVSYPFPKTRGSIFQFISFVLAVVQFVLLGLVAKDYFDRPNDYNVNSVSCSLLLLNVLLFLGCSLESVGWLDPAPPGWSPPEEQEIPDPDARFLLDCPRHLPPRRCLFRRHGCPPRALRHPLHGLFPHFLHKPTLFRVPNITTR